MTKRMYKVEDDMGACLEKAFEIAKQARDAGRYVGLDDSRVLDAYNRARANRLRYDRVTNVMRDNRLGELSRPSSPSEWPEATWDEALEYCAHEVWCDAVRAYNVKTM